MFVRDCMSSPVVSITPDTPFQTALQTMKAHNFRRLPVVDKYGWLAGIVSERDLLHAAPSPAIVLQIKIFSAFSLVARIIPQREMENDYL